MKNMIIKAIAITMLLSTILSCSSNSESNSNASISNEKQLAIEAYNFSHDLIKSYLASPSTAAFPKPWDVKLLSLGNDRYYIDGFVDSENDFGSKVRSEFECWVFYQRNTTIRLEKINFK